MDDLLVLLDRRDITVKMEGKVLRIERPDSTPERIPLKLIGRVVVYGSPMVSCDVWRKLADAGIPAVLFPGRGPGGPACLGSGLSTAVMIRIAQHRAATNPEAQTAVARHIIDSKLLMQQKLLQLLQKRDTIHQSDGATALSTTLAGCRLAIEQADSPDSVRGQEGGAANAWFGFLADILPSQWQFSGRNRRPPRDPVNGLLSLSYTMALAEVRHVVHQRGLDSGIGFLHTPRAGRESLLLDLLEPCRPAVDAFVLELIHTDLSPGHFSSSGKYGCRLNKEGRGIFYHKWAGHRLQWPSWNLPVNQQVTDKDAPGDDHVRLQYVVQQIMQGVINTWRKYDNGAEAEWEGC